MLVKLPKALAVNCEPGEWPTPPEMWSFSVLKQVERCPLQWTLQNADYKDLWSGRGYPPMPNYAALKGTIIHRVVERLLEALAKSGCTSPEDPAAVGAIVALGGFMRLIESEIEQILSQQAQNPRIVNLTDLLRSKLSDQEDSICISVKNILWNLDWTGFAAKTERSEDGVCTTLSPGVHSEVKLEVREMRLKGILDFVHVDPPNVTIVELKSGRPSPDHSEQLRLYNLLWNLDTVRNPRKYRVNRLLLSYPTGRQDIEPVSAGDERVLKESLIDRLTSAETALVNRSPQFNSEFCQFCSVRQLCNTYWREATVDETKVAGGAAYFGDLELRLIERIGETRWQFHILHPRQFAGWRVMIRRYESDETQLLAQPVHIRGLNLLLHIADVDSKLLEGRLTPYSEIFYMSNMSE